MQPRFRLRVAEQRSGLQKNRKPFDLEAEAGAEKEIMNIISDATNSFHARK